MVDLFSTSKMCGLELKNHFFRSATSERRATVDGHLTKELYHIYEKLAAGGIGTIFTGYTFVCKDEQPAPNMMGIYDDSFIDDYKTFTDMVHQYGTKIIMQIVYGGSLGQGNPENQFVWGPSAIPNQVSGIVPIEMSESDIHFLIGHFAEAARRVKESGFDGVQIHAAHGYLLSQFLSQNFNQRTDEYGGSIESRARIVMEVYSAVREKVGPAYPVMIKLNSSDDVEGGLTYNDSMAVSMMLAQAGIDAIEVSGGAYAQTPTSTETESYFRNYAIELAGKVSTPVILTGGNRSLQVMQQITDSSNVHHFGFCRPLLRNPAFVKALEQSNMEDR